MNEQRPFPIDYEAYDTDELADIAGFLALIEAYHRSKKAVDESELKAKHARFQEIVNSIAEEKRIDKRFEKQTGISIYRTMKGIE